MKPLAWRGPKGSGFSCIVFFKFFVVFIQTENEVFGFVAIINIITAWIHVLTGADLSATTGIFIAVSYAFWYPISATSPQKKTKKRARLHQSFGLADLRGCRACCLIETLFTSA